MEATAYLALHQAAMEAAVTAAMSQAVKEQSDDPIGRIGEHGLLRLGYLRKKPRRVAVTAFVLVVAAVIVVVVAVFAGAA